MWIIGCRKNILIFVGGMQKFCLSLLLRHQSYLDHGRRSTRASKVLMTPFVRFLSEQQEGKVQQEEEQCTHHAGRFRL